MTDINTHPVLNITFESDSLPRDDFLEAIQQVLKLLGKEIKGKTISTVAFNTICKQEDTKLTSKVSLDLE